MYLIENLLINWIQLTLPCTIDSSNKDQHQTTLHRTAQQSIKHEARRHRFPCTSVPSVTMSAQWEGLSLAAVAFLAHKDLIALRFSCRPDTCNFIIYYIYLLQTSKTCGFV